jgi:hypothetical protein
MSIQPMRFAAQLVVATAWPVVPLVSSIPRLNIAISLFVSSRIVGEADWNALNSKLRTG